MQLRHGAEDMEGKETTVKKESFFKRKDIEISVKRYLQDALSAMALGLFASFASGSKVVKGGIKGVLPVLVIMTVLSLAARLAGYGSVLGGLVGIFIIVMLPIGILTSYVLWKKGKIQVVDKEQK